MNEQNTVAMILPDDRETEQGDGYKRKEVKLFSLTSLVLA